METPHYDTAVVGLGCAGLGISYYFTMKGCKVIGLEKNSDSGAMGTSSYGFTRIWRVTHADKLRNDMMRESLKLWREIEQAVGKTLLENGAILNFGHPDSEFLKGIFSQFPDDPVIDGDEIMKKYPAFKNVPKDYIGMVTDTDCGVMRSNECLQAVKHLCLEQGADFQYNSHVVKIENDAQTGYFIITLRDGSQYIARNVIVACGYQTDKLKDETIEVMSYEVENFHIEEGYQGLPDAFLEDTPDHVYYGLKDGADLKSYKIGLHEERNIDAMMSYFQNRFDTNILGHAGENEKNKLKIKGSQPCFYSFGKDKKYNYSRGANGVYYAYGFTGTGFKFLPLHGKIMYSLVEGEDTGLDYPWLKREVMIARI